MDLEEFFKGAWERHGRLPAEVFGRVTPSQFLARFTRPARRPEPPDPVAELQRVNDERGRRGLLPVLTTWLLRR